jgi:metal-dependent amidase/aminoacylase/carboxypeptidase family protein
MEDRHDVLAAAAEKIVKASRLPQRMGGNMVATVGEIQNHPNSRNTIPERVHFTVDIRSWDTSTLSRLGACCERIAKRSPAATAARSSFFVSPGSDSCGCQSF